jgi:hypothetical protein
LLTGMQANSGQMRDVATQVDSWFVAGVGGTSISDAEIILLLNEHAQVTMAGGSLPDGLLTNDQFLEVLDKYGKQHVVDGRLVDKPDAASNPSWRLDVRPGGYINGPVTLVTDGWTGYDVTLNDRAGAVLGSYRAEGYVFGISRQGQAPSLVEDLAQQTLQAGHTVGGELLYDDDGRYIGYRLYMFTDNTKYLQFDVTGAASRWPPPYYIDGTEVVAPGGPIDVMYAPPTSGNFGGGFAASAEQARYYALWRRRHDPTTFLMPTPGATAERGE